MSEIQKILNLSNNGEELIAVKRKKGKKRKKNLEKSLNEQKVQDNQQNDIQLEESDSILLSEKKGKGKKKKRKHRSHATDSSSEIQSLSTSACMSSTQSLPARKKIKLSHSSNTHPESEHKPTIASTAVDEEKQKDEYPYEVVPDDHCETPLEAYQDIAPLLTSIAASLDKTPQTLSIYDPYYCEGQVKARLGSLGFHSVYNEKEDFYQNITNHTLPEYDLLLTNPPYSLDHIDRLLQFVVKEINTPFCLLLPNYVYMKDYYQKYMHFPFVYITPSAGKRYLYTTPKGRRQQKSSKITSPFPTFWYCGRISAALISQFKQQTNIAITQKIQNIPLEISPDNDPRKKKLRNHQKRKKNKQRQQQRKQQN